MHMNHTRKHILTGKTFKHLSKLFKMPKNILDKIIRNKVKKIDILKKVYINGVVKRLKLDENKLFY